MRWRCPTRADRSHHDYDRRTTDERKTARPSRRRSCSASSSSRPRAGGAGGPPGSPCCSLTGPGTTSPRSASGRRRRPARTSRDRAAATRSSTGSETSSCTRTALLAGRPRRRCRQRVPGACFSPALRANTVGPPTSGFDRGYGSRGSVAESDRAIGSAHRNIRGRQRRCVPAELPPGLSGRRTCEELSQ